jgi:putative membrane protein
VTATGRRNREQPRNAAPVTRRTLVLCVDRDDDLGRKVGIPGPLIGRGPVVEAATALAVADPEDSDVNSMFAAVKVLDEARERASPGHEYEVAAITWYRTVGPESDKRIVEQFESVLRAVKPDRLIVVTDGAEDEHVLPIFESRIRIDAVHRVVVKQARNLEGAYYLLIRLFEDERMRKRFILPASIALIVFGIAMAVGQVILAVGLALVTLGLFLLIHAMGWEAGLGRILQDFYVGLKSGKVSFFTTVLAVVLILFGGLTAYNDLHHNRDLDDPLVEQAQTDLLLLATLFVGTVNWWVLGGLTLNVAGRLVDDLVRKGSTRGFYWRLLFSLPALALILLGLTRAVVAWRTDRVVSEFLIDPTIYAPAVGGLVIALVGNYLYRYVRESLAEDDDEKPEAAALGKSE